MKILDRYVEWHVDFWEAVGLTKRVQAPWWWVDAWNMPDSASSKGAYAKSIGYHLGHVTAVLTPLVVAGAFVFV